MPTVNAVQYIEYTITIPGVEGAIFMKVPAGSPPPRVVVSETVAAQSAVVPIPELRVRVPFPVPRQAAHEISVDGHARKVPAAVARIAARMAKGERELRLRPEALDKPRLHLPEMLARLHRDHDRKVTSKGAVYKVGAVVVEAG